MIAINLSASFHAIKGALPHMRKRGWGRMVNIASAHGLVGLTKGGGARDRDEAKRCLLAEKQPSGEFATPASQIRGASLSIDGGSTAQ